MKRLLLGITLLLLLGIGLLVGLVSWGLGTTAGGRWLVDAAARQAGAELSVREFGGSLVGGLRLGGLQLVWAEARISIDHLALSWRPGELWRGRFAVERLAVDQVALQLADSADESDESLEIDFAATDLAVLPDWLVLEVDQLELMGFTYRDAAGPTPIADLISGHFTWSAHRLSAEPFAYRSPYVQLAGQFDWDLVQPNLVMDARVHLPETLVDPVLFGELAVPVDFAGRVELNGDWNRFAGPVRFSDDQAAGTEVELTAQVEGAWHGLRFTDLRGRYLQGELAGALELDWLDDFRMQGQLAGRQLALHRLLAEVEGVTTLDLEGALRVPAGEAPLQAELVAQIHAGTFRGHRLQGRAAVRWQDERLQHLDLDLRGEGTRLQASGVPDERLAIDVAVADLAPFYSGLAGAGRAAGWVRWRDDYLTGELAGAAERLAFDSYRLGALQFQGRHLERQGPFELLLSGRDGQSDRLRVARAEARLTGSLAAHELQLTAELADGRIQGRLNGEYREGVWAGSLLEFTGGAARLGRWTMAKPTRLTWRHGVVDLEELVLVSSQDERLAASIAAWGAPAGTTLGLQWHSFDLGRLTLLDPELRWQGRCSGEGALELAGRQPLRLAARIASDAGLSDLASGVELDGLQGELDWDDQGLRLSVRGQGAADERLDLNISSRQSPQWSWQLEDVEADLRWQELDLARLARGEEGLVVGGRSRGEAQLVVAAGQLQLLSAHLAAEGWFEQDQKRIVLEPLLGTLHWDRQRFALAVQAGLDAGQVSLRLVSDDDPRLGWPESGGIDLEVDALNVESLRPWLPTRLNFGGRLAGSAHGRWSDYRQVDLAGQLELHDGQLRWAHSQGQVRAEIRQAGLAWQWRGGTLSGSLALNLAERGELHGEWQLPLPARWPFALQPDRPLAASLEGRTRAVGLLTALLPELLQDVEGELALQLGLAGTWTRPVLGGDIRVSGGQAYVPYAGVQLKDLTLAARLAGDRIVLDQLSLVSGPGSLYGAGELVLEQWQPARYRLRLTGERFQLFELPELKLFCSPELELEGDLERLSVRGKVLIPEMSLVGVKTSPEVAPSRDAVVVSAVAQPRRTLPFTPDVQVAIELGEKVTVKAAGIDTALQGGVDVTVDPGGQPLARGEIRLAKGSYRAYGANLEIKQGVLRFAGGKATNPELNIFAARDIGTVQAGVQVTGTAEVPVVTLFSRPAMPERDILGYILMGRPLRADQQDADVLAIGAGALLPGSGPGLSDLGISEIDLQGLFVGSGGVRLRRRLGEKWEVESNLGVESGVDLYYIFEFD